MKTKGRFIGPIVAAISLAAAGTAWALFEDDELWGTDNLAEDDYGFYDSDFDWDVANETGFESWYGNADEDWGTYDDANEEGWFDW